MKTKISIWLAVVLLLAAVGCGKKAEVPHPTISQPGGAPEIDSALSLPDTMASALPRKTAALYMLESSSELAVKQAEDCFQLNLEEAELVSGGGFQVYSTEDYRVSVDMANGYWVYKALRPLPQSMQRAITGRGGESARRRLC